MAASEELRRFVKDGLTQGVARDRLEEVLCRAGWALGDVRGAISSYAEVEFPIPVPRPQANLSARDAFMYLLLFSTLFVSGFNLGAVLFELVNQAFPDPAVPASAIEAARESMRWSLATLLVAFPVFLGVSRWVSRELAADASKRASKIRRWLTYMTLFVASAVLIGDVTGMVFRVLGGELTTRFVLKVLTVAGIAGTAFWYYLSDLRADEREGHA